MFFMLSTQNEILTDSLLATERAEEIPEAADIYGWLVGSWDLTVHHYWGEDVSALGLTCEVHASWVLEGRAIQDVWIMPARSERDGPPDPRLNMCGTTLRVWDPTIEAWRISWRNPAGHHHHDQIGRRQGADIVQIGVRPDGVPTRWRFTELTGESFHWLGESLAGDGATWKLEGEFRGRRIGARNGKSLC
jgi:hypothetical protein